MRIALATGEAEVVDAGSPRMLRSRRGEVETIKLDEQLPLGMFSDTRYRAQPVSLRPGDRLIILSDGVFAARSRPDWPTGRRRWDPRCAVPVFRMLTRPCVS